MNELIDEDEDFDRQFECPVCHDLLVSPVTLMCQHTFCRLCIKSYVLQQSKPQVGDDGYQTYVSRKDKNPKCPMCRCAIVIPPNDNFVLKEIIETKYPELYKSRFENFHKKGILKLDIRDQIEEEIRSEVFSTVVDEAVHENRDTARNDNASGMVNIPSPYVNVESNHWIKSIFPTIGSFTVAWGVILFAFMAVMLKSTVDIKTYVGMCMIMWVAYMYFAFYQYSK